MADKTVPVPSRRRGSSMGGGVEALLREVLAGQAASDQRMNDVATRVTEIGEAAFRARDLAKEISTRLEEQNIVGRFTEHRGEMRQIVDGMRQDVVAANTRLRSDLDALETDLRAELKIVADRMKVLEDERQQREGIKSFLGWLMKNAPWLLAWLAAFVAGMGFKKEIG